MIHSLIEQEITLVGGDAQNVVIGGASQGCCVALDAAVNFQYTLGGCIASFGHIYSGTELCSSRKDLPIFHFHGDADEVIALSLAKTGWERLKKTGFTQIMFHTGPGLTHCEPSAIEFDMCARQLEAWGFWPRQRAGRPDSTAADMLPVTQQL